MSVAWHIELFGGLNARREAQEVVRFQSRKTGALLAILAYYLKQNHGRDELIERLWPETDLYKGRHSFCQALSSLRRQLSSRDPNDEPVILANHTHVRLNPQVVTTDVALFANAVLSARQAASTSERIPLLAQAAELHRGDLLPGLFDDWILLERERLNAIYVRVLRQLTVDLEQSGETISALDYALRAAGAAPDQEETHAAVMRLYLALGSGGEALRHYQQYARLLKRDGGQQPSAALRDMARLIRAQRAVPTRLSSVGRDTLPELRPESQTDKVGAVSGPPPAGPPAPGLDFPLFPLHLTRFFGREAEIAHLVQILRVPDGKEENRVLTSHTKRLVTLVGPGGCGKTRLALEAARQLKTDAGMQVVFVSLVDIKEAEHIVPAIVDALHLPRTEGDFGDQVVNALNAGPACLVLDNFEHLVVSGAQWVWRLLGQLPLLACLVTSRTPLGLEGEVLFPVPPLATPQANSFPKPLEEYACVQMFLDRAQTASTTFEMTPRNAAAVAAVCQQLEGIPLAIELAAARANVLTPMQMLAQLTSRFDFLTNRSHTDTRHQTLREAISWSYNALSPQCQRFFQQLACFRGGWTLEAAQVVCEEPGALELLQQLQQHALVMACEGREEMQFHMLETLREYAWEQLTPGQHEDVLCRHATFMLNLAEEAEPHLRGQERERWLDRLESEQENLRAALDWFGAGEDGMRLAGALWRFWLLRGYVSEGRHWLTRAMEGRTDESAARARALNGLGVLAEQQGDLAEAWLALQESLALWKRQKMSEGLAQTLNSLAILADKQGDYTQASAYAQQSLQIYRDLQIPRGIAATLNTLGRQEQHRGDLEAARACYRESHGIYRELGDQGNAAAVLMNLGSTSFELMDWAAARAAFEQSLALFRQTGNRAWIATLLHNLGETLYRQANADAARPLLKESLAIRQELGDRQGIAFSLAGMGNIAISEGRYVRAARLFAASEEAHETYAASLSPSGRALREQDIAAIREALSETDFTMAQTYGRALSLEQAVAYALKEEDDQVLLLTYIESEQA